MEEGKCTILEVGVDQVLKEFLAAALIAIAYKRLKCCMQQVEPFPHILGHKFSGAILKVNRQVKEFWEGKEVYGDSLESAAQNLLAFGSLVENVFADESKLQQMRLYCGIFTGIFYNSSPESKGYRLLAVEIQSS